VRVRFLSGLALAGLFLSQGGCAPSRVSEADVAVASSGASEALPEAARGPLAVAVYKERRELVLLRDGLPDQSFSIRLGRNPDGPKTVRGDHRTPEGLYRICTVKPSRFRSFLWLTYPNEDDAWRALDEGRLTRDQYSRIVNALASGACPPADTPLGGLVGIHGDYESPPRHYDWTEGCIALPRSEDLTRLASVVRPGTPVVIYP
jgi:murein L,D-transpeptidase YafK